MSAVMSNKAIVIGSGQVENPCAWRLLERVANRNHRGEQLAAHVSMKAARPRRPCTSGRVAYLARRGPTTVWNPEMFASI